MRGPSERRRHVHRPDTFAPGASPERWTSFRADLQLELPDAFEDLHSWRDGMLYNGFYGGERAIAGQTLLGLDDLLRVKATWDDFAREGATKTPERGHGHHVRVVRSRRIHVRSSSFTPRLPLSAAARRPGRPSSPTRRSHRHTEFQARLGTWTRWDRRTRRWWARGRLWCRSRSVGVA